MRTVFSMFKLIFAVFIAATLSAGLIGASYSLYTGANYIKNSVSTGDIDVSFSSLYIAQDGNPDDSCFTSAGITDSGRLIEINVRDAYPGYTATIIYEITNNGSVPVTYDLVPPDTDWDEPVELQFSEGPDYIKSDGGKARGRITVTVGDDIGDCEGCCLNTKLNFQQAFVEVS